MQDPHYLTIGAVASRCGCPPWQVRRLFERGLLPPAPRVGAYRVIAAADLPLVEKALRDAGYLPQDKGRIMSGNKPLQDNPDAVAPTVEALLVPAHVAGPMCGRSKASWRDHTAGRIPAPIKLGGRSLWRVEELRRWVEAGCPSRTVWEGGAGDQQGRPEMNLDDLPEFVPIAFLEGYGITAEDVRRRCPLAVEYGLASAPYWHRDDLAQLLIGPARGNEE